MRRDERGGGVTRGVKREEEERRIMQQGNTVRMRCK